MRTLLLCTVVVLVAAADTPKDAAKEIDGVWEGVSVEVKGLKADLIVGWDVKEGEMTQTFMGRPTGTFTLKVDARKKPREIDLTPKDGGPTRKGIWKVEKGKLTVCMVRSDVKNPGKRARPKAFTTRGRADVEVLTLKRKAS